MYCGGLQGQGSGFVQDLTGFVQGILGPRDVNYRNGESNGKENGN